MLSIHRPLSADCDKASARQLPGDISPRNAFDPDATPRTGEEHLSRGGRHTRMPSRTRPAPVDADDVRLTAPVPRPAVRRRRQRCRQVHRRAPHLRRRERIRLMVGRPNVHRLAVHSTEHNDVVAARRIRLRLGERLLRWTDTQHRDCESTHRRERRQCYRDFLGHFPIPSTSECRMLRRCLYSNTRARTGL